MNARALIVGAALSTTAGIGFVAAQTPPSVDSVVSAAKRSAGLEWPGTFLRLCIAPPPAAGRGRGSATGTTAPAGPPPKSSWYAEPAKVADNFYFLGTKIHNAWALVGSEGIIVFEALFDYAAPDEIADGMRKLGLDINRVRYVVISHAHGDHDGGARFCRTRCRRRAWSTAVRTGTWSTRRRTGPAANHGATWWAKTA
jgi:metallo-beta-lactamase class B